MTRREFLMAAVAAAGGLTLAETFHQISKAQALLKKKALIPLVSAGVDPSQTPTPTNTFTPTNTPIPTDTPVPSATPKPTGTKVPVGPLPPPGDPIVLHVRHSGATNWTPSNQSQRFYQQVNQTAVDQMAERGLKDLTGEANWGDIWSKLFTRIQPDGYQPGQKIAIKVNMNYGDQNNNNCSNHDNMIDATPQPIAALLAGMAAAGVQMSDVTIYDSTGGTYTNNLYGRSFYQYFRDYLNSRFSGLHFVGTSGCGVTQTTYGKESSLTVDFGTLKSRGLQDRLLTDVLADATYLINVPIMKGHSGEGGIPFSGVFKNHLGSINYVYASNGADSIHDYITPSNSRYDRNNSALVDIYLNANIANKTVLTMMDGLFGSLWNQGADNNWSTFGGKANSLFFAIDPVALDTILADIVRAEGRFSTSRAYDFLYEAQTAGLGHTEATAGSSSRHPFAGGYSTIQYSRVNLS